MKYNLSCFEIEKNLGHGGFGTVFKAKNKKDNKIYALKKIHLKNLSEAEKNNVKNESKNLSAIDHENIVKYYDDFYEGDSFYIIMEFCEGLDLTKFIEKHKTSHKLIDKKIVLKIIKDICFGLIEIQKRKLIHRDLKPDNIFLNKENTAKIGDFGISKQLDTMRQFAKTAIGTIVYMAPEFLKGNYNYKVDNWSLGCIIHELCTLKLCFNGANFISVANAINKAKPERINKSFYGEFLQNIIDSLLQKDFTKRAEVGDILDKIQKYEKIKRINNLNMPPTKNEISCVYFSKEHEDIKLIENFQDINFDNYDDNFKSYMEAKNDNNHLLDNHNIEIYVNDRKINSNIYNIKNSEEIKVKIKFKKLLNSAAYLFKDCYKLKSIDLSSFNTSNISKMTGMFLSCLNLESVNLSGCITSKVIKMTSMFMHCNNLKSIDLSGCDTSSVNSMRELFCDCTNLKSINLSSLNTNNLVNVRHMFSFCYSLEKLDLSAFQTNEVSYMDNMFCYCTSLTSLNISSLNTSNVSSMSSMFEGCYKLDNLNLSSFDTINVTDMSKMFDNCRAIKYINLRSFKTNNVEDMSFMFSGCHNLKVVNLSSFNTCKVKNFEFMFNDCYSIDSINLSSFQYSNVENMKGMFKQCNSLKELIMKNFIPPSLVEIKDLFDGCLQPPYINIRINEFNIKFFKEIQKTTKNFRFEIIKD